MDNDYHDRAAELAKELIKELEQSLPAIQGNQEAIIRIKKMIEHAYIQGYESSVEEAFEG